MRRIGYILLVVALVATHLTVSTGRAQAATTGSTTEVAILENTVNFVDLEIDEVQSISNDATGGTFTLSFDGVGPTGPIAYNGSSADVKAALESLPNIADVSVTGANPWEITFHDPGAMDVPPLVPDDGGLTPGTSSSIVTELTAGLSAPIDPAGVTYLSDSDRLLVSDSEINEEPDIFDGVNLWEMTRDVMTGNTTPVVFTGVEDAPIPEPTGLSYNPANDHVYITNDNSPAGVRDVDPGGDDIYGTSDDTVTFMSTKPSNCSGPVPFCMDDPEDVAWDSAGGQIFIVGGIEQTLSAVEPGDNDVFDGLIGHGGDDVAAGTWDLGAFITNPEGIDYRASSDTLLILDEVNKHIFEVTKSGRLIREIDIDTPINLPNVRPSDIVLAPKSDDLDPSILSMYVTDRARDNNCPVDCPPAFHDGRMFELTAPFANLAPFVSAGPDKSITIGDPLTLTGDSYDDGQPNVAAPSVAWSKVSGPGSVTFGSPSSLSTSVSFSAVGTYVLKLSSTDGALASEDTVQVQVSAVAPTNAAPTVSAGSDQVVTLPGGAFLSGSASDDGLPNPPGSLTTTWTKVSGPGTVTFANPSSPNTSASFSASGTYVLRLTANDGALQASDTMKVVVNPPSLPPGGTFIDDDGNTHEANIEAIAAEGITKGCNPPTNDLYCPGDPVTRGQMAAFLVRAMGYTDTGGGDLFIDDDDSIFENDIDKLATAGVTKGCNPPANTEYCPDDFVTRGQMAAFLVRAMGYTDTGGGDLFIDDDASIFENDIDKLATAGVTKGCNPPSNTMYCPDEFVLRDQMASFLARALGLDPIQPPPPT